MNIIYIDDSEFLIVITKRFLEDLGHNVNVVESPNRVLEILHDYDVIFLDYCHKYYVCEGLIKRIRKISNIPVVVISAYLTEEIEKLCGGFGANGYLSKIDLTRDKLQDILDRQHER